MFDEFKHGIDHNNSYFKFVNDHFIFSLESKSWKVFCIDCVVKFEEISK